MWDLHHSRITTQMPRAHVFMESTDYGPEHRQIHKGRPAWICGQQNVRAIARDKTEENTDEKYTSSPRKKIKIPSPAENRIRAAELEGRDSIDHATATDEYLFLFVKFGVFLS